jgi:hypothetical protein
MDLNPNFVIFVFLIKLKCNKGHIHGLNWILSKIVKILNIYYMSSVFYAKSILTERKRPPRVIFQLDMVHN